MLAPLQVADPFRQQCQDEGNQNDGSGGEDAEQCKVSPTHPEPKGGGQDTCHDAQGEESGGKDDGGAHQLTGEHGIAPLV
jgi:hypothetical protein